MAAGDVEIAASRRNRCATTGSIGSEATGAWLRRHAIAEDMGRTHARKRGDSSPMSFAPRTFTTGTLEVPRDEEEMMCAILSGCWRLPRGVLNLWVAARRDRCRPFKGKKLKLNTESPRGGGWVNLWGVRRRRTGASLMRRFFFCTPEILGFQTQSKKSKAESFQCVDAGAASWTRHLFSAFSPRGAVKSLALLDRGPVGQARASFREIPKNFFCCAAHAGCCKKTSRNSGWGGRSEPDGAMT